MDYAIRVTRVHDRTAESVIDFCKKYFDEYLVVYEDPDDDCHNEHYHIHGISNSKMDTLKKALQRLFPKSYSLKEADERNIQYICKGNPTSEFGKLPIVIDVKGSQFEDIEEWHRKYWDEFEELNGEFDPDYKRRKRCTTEQLLDEVAQKLPDQWFDIKDKPHVLKLMFDVWQSYGKVLNLYRARDYYYHLAYKLAPQEDAQFDMCQMLTDKW